MATSKIYEKDFSIYLRDTDKNNKMRYSSYLNIMQEIGGLHADELGHGLNEEIKTGKAWIVIAWKLEIFKRPGWNEKIKVRTWIGKVDKIYHYRDYELLDNNGEVIAKGVAQWVMLDTVNKRIMRSDESYVSEFELVEREDYDNSINKINTRINQENLEEIYKYIVERRDVDKNNHMNNIVYLDLALEGLSEEEIDNISNIEIHYKTECKYDEEIVFAKEKVEDKNNIYILDKNKEKVYSLVILK